VPVLLLLLELAPVPVLLLLLELAPVPVLPLPLLLSVLPELVLLPPPPQADSAIDTNNQTAAAFLIPSPPDISRHNLMARLVSNSPSLRNERECVSSTRRSAYAAGLQSVTGLCRSMTYQLEAEKRFALRIRLGLRAVGWIEGEL
jgi:hypothetical protein